MEEDKKEREAQEEDDAPSLKNVSIVGSEPIAVGSPVLLQTPCGGEKGGMLSNLEGVAE